MYGKFFRIMFTAALWLTGLFLSVVYAFFAVAVVFFGLGLVVCAFSYPPHYSSLMIIAGMIVVFSGDWMMQNSPPSLFLVLSRRRLIARPG
jgi:hypothetical protein